MYNTPTIDISEVFSIIYDLFYSLFLGQGTDGTFQSWWEQFYPSFKSASTLISLILATGLIYSLIRFAQIRAKEHHELVSGEPLFGPVTLATVTNNVPQSSKTKWQTVEKHVSSENPSDWRLAILEADIILDDMTRELYPAGENIGERLRNMARGDFKTLGKAGEAHGIRNAIAHQGINFMISEREARRIVSLYEEVFREFNYI